MKQLLKGVVIGIVFTIALMISLTVFADSIFTKVDVVLNSANIVVNGNPVNAETLGYNGKTYVPVRDLCNIFDKDIFWDGTSRTVYINDKTTPTVDTDPISASKNELIARVNKLIDYFNSKKDEYQQGMDKTIEIYTQKVNEAKAICEANKNTLKKAWDVTGAPQSALEIELKKEDDKLTETISALDELKNTTLSKLQKQYDNNVKLVSLSNQLIEIIKAKSSLEELQKTEAEIKKIEDMIESNKD